MAAFIAQGDTAMARRTITVTVDVADGSEVESLAVAEDIAFGAAAQVFGQVLQQLADERQEQVDGCPQCGGEQVRRKGRRGRRLYTRMGEVHLSRQRCECVGCGHMFFPLAGELGGA
jgi:hypothetical protein